MAADLWLEFSELLLVGTAALLLIAAVRKPVRHRFGARAAYALWLALPLAALATLLPAPAAPVVTASTLGSIANIGHASVGIEHATAFNPLPWLLIWTGGVLLSLLWTMQQQRRFQHDLGDLQPASDGSHRSRHADAPALVGLLHPRIVLPADFEQRYTPTEQSLVLAHERSHLRHFDAWANAAASLTLCLLWFHPLAWWAVGRFRFDQELACDARVLDAAPQSRRAYADALLKTQLHADAAWRLPLGCHWQSSHPLTERVAMLKATSLDRPRRMVGLAAVLAICSAGAFAAWAAQPSKERDGSDAAPRMLQSVQSDDSLTPPKYPAKAKADGISGKVVLHVEVQPDGQVSDVKVVKAEPAGIFEKAATDAARQWRLNPVRKDGIPVVGWMEIPVQFTADAKGAQPSPEPTGSEAGSNRASVLATDLFAEESRALRPRYPADALAEKHGGQVILKIWVNPDGSAGEILIQQSSSHDSLDRSAAEAAAKWSYNPGRKDGKAVGGWVLMPVKFSPDSDESTTYNGS